MNAADLFAASMMATWAVPSFLTAYGTRLTRQHLATSPAHLDAPFALYPISVLKPLKGLDPGLRDNLESFFAQDYPGFELIFSIADPRDPARAPVEALLRRYPEVRARLIVGQEIVGPNPKINNLMRSYRAAAHDWVLISDSNIRVAPDYLRRLFACVDNGVGVVTSLVAGADPGDWGGYLEAARLSTFFARGMRIADRLGRPCVLGKSMLFRRSTARRFGGIEALARYLAEDFMAGEAMRKLGLRIALAPDPVDQHIGRHRVRDYWARQLRWARIRKSQAPVAFLGEALANAIVTGLAGATAFHALFGLPWLPCMLLHLLGWATSDALLMRRMTRGALPFRPLAWLMLEGLAVPLWLHAFAGNSVRWRGRRLRLLPGGLLDLSAEASHAS